MTFQNNHDDYYDCIYEEPKNNNLELYNYTEHVSLLRDPIFNIMFARGISRKINEKSVEFYEDLIQQRITIVGLNCDAYSHIFELIYPDGTRKQIHNNDLITLRANNSWNPFGTTSTKYVIICNHFSGDKVIMEILISTRTWNNKNDNNIRRDIISLLSVQSDQELALPQRTFYNLLDQIGQGVNNLINTYKDTGELPKLAKSIIQSSNDEYFGIFPGLISVFEHGSDQVLGSVIEFITGLPLKISDLPIERLRRTNKLTSKVLGSDIIAELGLICMYDTLLPDSLLLALRDIIRE